MKKLILSLALLAGGMSTFAITGTTFPTETMGIIVSQEFSEISIEDLPSAVTDAVEKDFATATIDKAYVNTSKQYKLELSVEGESKTVYADTDGNWLEESDVNS